MEREKSMRRSIVIVLSAFLTAQTANCETGNKLLSRCQDRDNHLQSGFCMGYVSAMAEFVSSGMWVLKACAPRNVTYGQLVDIVIRDLQSRPEHRHEQAFGLVAAALLRAFPCKQ